MFLYPRSLTFFTHRFSFFTSAKALLLSLSLPVIASLTLLMDIVFISMLGLVRLSRRSLRVESFRHLILLFLQWSDHSYSDHLFHHTWSDILAFITSTFITAFHCYTIFIFEGRLFSPWYSLSYFLLGVISPSVWTAFWRLFWCRRTADLLNSFPTRAWNNSDRLAQVSPAAHRFFCLCLQKLILFAK